MRTLALKLVDLWLEHLLSLRLRTQTFRVKAGHAADNCLHHFKVEALGQDSITHSWMENIHTICCPLIPNLPMLYTLICLRTLIQIVIHIPGLLIRERMQRTRLLKDSLHLYQAFNCPLEVNGIGGVPTYALGSGSLASQDPYSKSLHTAECCLCS